MMDLKALKEIVLPIVRAAGVELFDMAVKSYCGTANIKLTVDHADGGVSIEECADVNRKVAEAVGESGIYGDDYTVSVSSPGLDRPLIEERDFRRIIGWDIGVSYVHDGDPQTRNSSGTVRGVADGSVLIETKEGVVTILLKNIQKADVMV